MSDEAFDNWEPRRPLIIDACPDCGFDLRHHEKGQCDPPPKENTND